MGELTENVVLLFDNYGLDSQNLHTSFLQAGKNYPVVVIEEDGFLPEGVISVYGYFLGDFEKSDRIPGKPRYFNQIKVPEYWEISANNTKGQVHNLNKERARIFYAEPKHKRLVKTVDWYDDRGVVRSSDHYNRQGALYGRTIFNAEGKKFSRTYFDAAGREIIVENYVTHDIILNDGDTVRIFHNKTDFVVFFMERAGYTNHRVFFNTLSTSFFVSQRMPMENRNDILFWQEARRNDIPGNMKGILNGAARATKIMVQKREAYDKLAELGAPTTVIQKLGYIYPFKKENQHKPEVLICTNSDRIAQLQTLVEALPELHFRIAALTEMSSKLMSMDRYDNVSLYPGAKPAIFDDLFESCDYYLDINHETEIVSAVQRAFLHNHVILAFKEVMHNAAYTAPEHVFTKENPEAMISLLKEMLASKDLTKQHVELQHVFALSEEKETYQVL